MFETKPRKVENYNINSLNIAFVYDRQNKTGKYAVGKEFENLIAQAEDPNATPPNYDNWVWNVATVIGTQYQRGAKNDAGKPTGEFELSETAYRVNLFHASGKDMQHVKKVLDKVTDTFCNSPYRYKNKKKKSVIEAENYLLNNALLLGSGLVSEEKDNSYISMAAGKMLSLQQFTVPTRRPQEYLLK